MTTLFDLPPEAPAEPRVMRMAPDNPEVCIRDSVLEAMEGRYASLLEYLRMRLRRLYEQRLRSQGHELARVTADDARHILDSDPDVPGPQVLSRNFLGQLFRHAGWRSTGELIHSRTPGSHGNLLRCWRWEERA